MTPLQYFRHFAKEFDGLPDEDVTAQLTVAELFVVVDALTQERADACRALYAAHLEWIDKNQTNNGSVKGVVTSEREDKQSRSYGTISGSDTLLGLSPYGQLYMTFTAAQSVGPITRYDA